MVAPGRNEEVRVEFRPPRLGVHTANQVEKLLSARTNVLSVRAVEQLPRA
jgi:hypothetical protein